MADTVRPLQMGQDAEANPSIALQGTIAHGQSYRSRLPTGPYTQHLSSQELELECCDISVFCGR